MGHYVHKTFTAVGHSTGWLAFISAIKMEMEDGHPFTEHLAVAAGRNGNVSLCLMPHGGKSGTDWERNWLKLKVRIRREANRNGCAWTEVTWGGDQEGLPHFETESYRVKLYGFKPFEEKYDVNGARQRDKDPDEVALDSQT